MEPSAPHLGFSEIPIEAQPRPTFGPPRPPSFIPDAPIHMAKAPAWRASEALVANPAAIDNPVTVAGAAAEMKTFNATWHAPSDPDSVISECRAAMSQHFRSMQRYGVERTRANRRRNRYRARSSARLLGIGARSI